MTAGSLTMNGNDFLPVILGSDENAYENARLFHEAYGIKPLVVCKHGLIPTAGSRIIDLVTVRGLDDDGVFVSALGSLLEEKSREYGRIVVVPCSDYYTHLLSKHMDVLGRYISNGVPRFDLLTDLDTKDAFYRLCDRFGMDYPKTLTVSPKERDSVLGRDGLLDRALIFFPFVMKPENSNASEYLNCSFEGKKKVYFLNNAEEYRRVINGMKNAGYNGNLIIQEFIPGGDDAMRVVNTYSGKDGKTLAASLGQPVLEEYSPATLGNYAAIIPRSDDALCRKIADFLDGIGYTGFANFDMKYDRRTGRYMLFEINCRPGRSSFYVRGAGLNLMKLMTDDTVYGKRPDGTVFTHDTALWTAVPKGVLKKYVKDPVLKNEILSLWRQGRVFRSLFNRGDMGLRRRLRIFRYYLSYYKSFSRYYFDKDGNE